MWSRPTILHKTHMLLDSRRDIGALLERVGHALVAGQARAQLVVLPQVPCAQQVEPLSVEPHIKLEICQEGAAPAEDQGARHAPVWLDGWLP